MQTQSQFAQHVYNSFFNIVNVLNVATPKELNISVSSAAWFLLASLFCKGYVLTIPMKQVKFPFALFIYSKYLLWQLKFCKIIIKNCKLYHRHKLEVSPSNYYWLIRNNNYMASNEIQRKESSFQYRVSSRFNA